MIFGEVCPDRFNFGGVNYDFLSAASRIWNLAIFGRPGRSPAGYSDYLENTRSFRCHTQFERHGLWGSVWDVRNERFGGLELLRH